MTKAEPLFLSLCPYLYSLKDPGPSCHPLAGLVGEALLLCLMDILLSLCCLSESSQFNLHTTGRY